METALSRKRKTTHSLTIAISVALLTGWVVVGCAGLDDASGSGGIQSEFADGGNPFTDPTGEPSLFADPSRGQEVVDATGGVGGGAGGAGGDPGQDAGVDSDAGVFDDASTGPPTSITSDEYEALVNRCYDQASVCTDAACHSVAACCVGTANCCAPLSDPPLPTLTNFGNCDGQAGTDCGSDLLAFGEAGSDVQSDGFVATGDLDMDSGILVGEAVDLGAHSVIVSGTLSYGAACDDSCVDTLGFGFVAAPSGQSPTTTHVGLLYSGARDQVQLIVADRVAGSWNTTGAQQTWALSVQPNGVLSVRAGPSVVAERDFAPEGLRNVRLAVFGRSLQPEADRTALSELSTLVSICDQPDGWLGVQRIVTGDAPSVANGNGGEQRIAFERSGALRWATDEGDTVIGNALGDSLRYERGDRADPELVWDGTQWHLFYTAVSDIGMSAIAHAIANANDDTFVQDGAPTLTPAHPWVGFSSPTVYYRSGLWVMVVVGHTADGEQELVPFYRADSSTAWKLVASSELRDITRTAGGAGGPDHPSLIVHNRAYQLYYEQRAGTQASIALLVSDELTWFLDRGVVWRGGADFDQQSAGAPDALSGPQGVSLYYAGSDGLSTTIGRTTRNTP